MADQTWNAPRAAGAGERRSATRVSDALPRALRFEPTPKRVRADFAGVTVADSSAAILVWEARRAVPAYAFPRGDVRAELLTASERPLPEAHGGGAQLWSISHNGRTEENAAWRYADEALREYVAFNWEAMDRWREEEEEVLGHPRDPFHRVDGRASSRHVLVELEGEALADSRRPTLVFETGLPMRCYLPREDVRMDRLESTATRTTCA